jgi:hypothetical protein
MVLVVPEEGIGEVAVAHLNCLLCGGADAL